MLPEPAYLAKAGELWEALIRHAAADQPDLLDATRRDILLGIVEDAEHWSQELHALPRTLIHNDFNPRNIAVQDGRLVVYDWELATIDLPQRDVVELLAFTLDADATAADVDRFLAVHVRAVAEVSPMAATLVASCDWRHGYRLALREFLMTRMALYAAGHTQREFDFLPEVVMTAFHLWDLEQPQEGA
ncbi:phosphotransferase [[Kitasatospora] papulosa]|uniref:phosphotransferase n=1 Tax=[Kitasatospora] papulosa TaxID=1464011 RepID=UPI00364545D6